jgi:hypothetical protein
MATDTTDTSDSNDLARENAIHHLKAKRAFLYNAFTYVVINVFLWLLWAFTNDGDGGLPWPAWVTLGWGVGLAFQAWSAYGNHQISEADIQREMNRPTG